MNDDLLRYDLMIETALRNVVRKTLSAVAQNGLPGEHHFYITFLTNHPGVEIPDYLRKQYADEMTIVLQYQFFGLKVDEEAFGVTLSFNNIKERLRIPIEAITTFADPSVNFALQFQSAHEQDDDEEEPTVARSPRGGGKRKQGVTAQDTAAIDSVSGAKARKDGEKDKPAKDKGGPSSDDKDGDKSSGEKRGEVISLDLFRKK
ncbi:MAG: ClpXP protease specificity-enhancing factor SspB [Bdellovibrionales bacterium]